MEVGRRRGRSAHHEHRVDIVQMQSCGGSFECHEERRKVGRTFVPAFVVFVTARTRTLLRCTAVLRRLLVIETQRHVQRLRLDSQLGQTEAGHVREEPLSACCINN